VGGEKDDLLNQFWGVLWKKRRVKRGGSFNDRFTTCKVKANIVSTKKPRVRQSRHLEGRREATTKRSISEKEG